MSGKTIKFASVSDFDGDKSRIIKEIKGREIAVFKRDGKYHAVLNFCVHIGGPLCEGPVTNPVVNDENGEWTEWRYDKSTDVIRCPWHNWEFDIETGKNLQSEKYKVPTYDVTVSDGTVYLEI